MPIAVPTSDKTAKTASGAAGPVATGGRGLKGLFSRNRVISPEPAEPVRSRFRSLVDDVTARGRPGTRKDRTTGAAPAVSSPRRDDDRTPRPTVRPRPTTPVMTVKRTGRVGVALPPVMQKGNDGKWQPPSLSKGSMSASALAQLHDNDEDKTARPLEARKGKPALHALFGSGIVDKSMASNVDPKAPADLTIKSPRLDKTTPPTSRFKATSPMAKVLPAAPPTKIVSAPQTPTKPAPPSAMRTPASRSASQSSVERPGSRHTSRLHVSQPSSPTHPHLSLSHYHVRLATSFLLKQLTPIIKGSAFASKQSNADMRRIADDRLAILGRIERNWGPDWIRAAAQVKEAGDDGVPEGQVRMANVGERAKERERKAFLDGMRDGVLLCLYLNITFPSQPSHILQISMTDDGMSKATNISRFINACRAVSLPADATFCLADIKDDGEDAVGRIAKTIVLLARLAGRQRPKSPAMSRSPVRTSPRPPSRNATIRPPGSPPGLSKVEITSTPMGSPTRPSAPLRPISPTRSSPPQSRMMDRTRSADSANDLQAKLQAAEETRPPSQVATPRSPTTPTRHGSGSTSPRESPLLPRQSLIRSQTQPDVSPTLRPRSSRSPTPTSGSATPTHSRRPSLRPRNTAPGNSTRVSFAEEQSPTSRGEVTGLPPNLHIKERTPSLVSGTTDYTRSSAAYSALTVLGDIPDDAAVAVDLSSDVSPAATAAKRDRSRRNSEKTLHEARQRFIGSFATPADLAAAFRPLDDAESILRADAFSQSLAALEGASPGGRASPAKMTPKSRTSSSESERPRAIEEEGGKQTGARPLPGRRTSAGKYYLPKSSTSPTQLGPSPDPSPTMPGFIIMGPPAMRPTSRNSGRTSVDLTRQSSRVDRRPSDRSSVYRPVFAASAVDMTRTPSDQSRSDSRTRNHSMNPGGPVSRRNSDRSMWSRPASIVVLDFPGPDDDLVRYHLGSIIGRGQFGVVHKALNMSTGQMVAIKRISLEGMDDKQVHDVMHEVDLLKSLSHPSIVRYEGMKQDEETLDIVLEYIENGSLGSLIKDFGNPSEKLVASYTSKILEGLDYLHGQGVIHRDLKAANILSTKNGNIKLSDFGVSLNTRAVENIQQEVMTASMNGSKPNLSDVVGTPNWMAPEIIEMSGASFASDIWSLGCTIVELLTGRPPYANIGNSLAVMYKIVQDIEPPIPDGVSETLDHFLRLCFEKEPRHRPSAAKLFEHAWLRANCPELALLRGQDSVPFLGRVSIETSRTGLHQLFPERGADARSRPVSFAGSTSTRTEDGSLERKRLSLLASNGSSINLPAKAHVLIKTTFAKPITCRICQKPAKSGVLCETCGLLCHAYCANREITPCDAVEQAARSARQRELSATSAADSTTSVNVLPDSGETTKAWKRPKAALERRVSDLLQRQGENGSKASTEPLPPQGEEPEMSSKAIDRDGQETVRPTASKTHPLPSTYQSNSNIDNNAKHEKGKDSKSDCAIM